MKMAVRMRYLIALCVFALGCSDIALAQESPQVVLSRPSDPGLADRGIIVFSISNPTDKPVAIVSFETPFATGDDHLANVEFQVSDSKNEELAYRGRNVYFGPPDSSSFLTLGPHETLKKNVDVAKEYGITDGGAYTVTYVKNLRILRSSGVQRLDAVRPGDDIPLEPSRSNTLTIWINDALIKAQGAVARQHAAEEGVAALTCSGSQSSTLSSDVSASAAQTLSALTHLGASYSYDYDANNIPNVLAHFERRGRVDHVAASVRGQFVFVVIISIRVHLQRTPNRILPGPQSLCSRFAQHNRRFGRSRASMKCPSIQNGDIKRVKKVWTDIGVEQICVEAACAGLRAIDRNCGAAKPASIRRPSRRDLDDSRCCFQALDYGPE